MSGFACTWCAGTFVTRGALAAHHLEDVGCGRNATVSNPLQSKYGDAGGEVADLPGQHVLDKVETKRRMRQAASLAWFREVRAATPCTRCGARPVEYHRAEHVVRPQDRVSTMASRGEPVEKIAAEIARCEALCRSCHMRVDGRIETFRTSPEVQPPRECSECGRLFKPLRRGLCAACDQKRRRQRSVLDASRPALRLV